MHSVIKALGLAALMTSFPIAGHPGGLNAEGCHNNRKTGEYHCHRGGTRAPSRERTAPLGTVNQSSQAYFPNCSAARAAGAAPIRRGEPGYRSGLDRDDDGIACE